MTVKFRGKSQMAVSDLINSGIGYKGNGWVEGYLIQQGNDSYIINGVIEANSEYISIGEWVPVFTDSVGQFTGLKDSHGVDIYEGDIIKTGETLDWLNEDIGVIRFLDGAFFIDYHNLDTEFDYIGNISLPIEVVGNIYENPELLEGDNDD